VPLTCENLPCEGPYLARPQTRPTPRTCQGLPVPPPPIFPPSSQLGGSPAICLPLNYSHPTNSMHISSDQRPSPLFSLVSPCWGGSILNSVILGFECMFCGSRSWQHRRLPLFLPAVFSLSAWGRWGGVPLGLNRTAREAKRSLRGSKAGSSKNTWAILYSRN